MYLQGARHRLSQVTLQFSFPPFRCIFFILRLFWKLQPLAQSIEQCFSINCKQCKSELVLKWKRQFSKLTTFVSLLEKSKEHLAKAEWSFLIGLFTGLLLPRRVDGKVDQHGRKTRRTPNRPSSALQRSSKKLLAPSKPPICRPSIIFLESTEQSSAQLLWFWRWLRDWTSRNR